MSELNVGVKKGLKRKISISIDADILEDFNEIARAKRYNKSRTISNLIKAFVKNEKNEKSLIK